MVKHFLEAEEDYSSNNYYENAHRIEYIVEWVELLADLPEDAVDSKEMTAAIKKLYDAVSDFEDAYSRSQR